MSRDENVEAWFRRDRKVRVDLPGGGTIVAPKSAFSEPAEKPEMTEQAVADVVTGGADGGAHSPPDQRSTDERIDEEIRDVFYGKRVGRF